MSLLRHEFFPRSMFDMDNWFRSPLTTFPYTTTPSLLGSTVSPLSPISTLDLFDPFDELDNVISRNLQWLNRPQFLESLPMVPRVPQKYRVAVDCSGFSPNSIKTELKENNKLIVSGREEAKPEIEGGDYSIREFKKTYQLPQQAEVDKMVSFMAGNDRLIVEVPLKETETSPNADLFPQIQDNPDGTKSVQMRFVIPENIDPSKVSVSVKDRDLIFRAEDRVDKPDRHTRFHYYKRTTLPENTRFDSLKCIHDKDMITVSAPLDLEYTRQYRSLPIQHKIPIQEASQQPSIQQQQQPQPQATPQQQPQSQETMQQ